MHGGVGWGDYERKPERISLRDSLQLVRDSWAEADDTQQNEKHCLAKLCGNGDRGDACFLVESIVRFGQYEASVGSIREVNSSVKLVVQNIRFAEGSEGRRRGQHSSDRTGCLYGRRGCPFFDEQIEIGCIDYVPRQLNQRQMRCARFKGLKFFVYVVVYGLGAELVAGHFHGVVQRDLGFWAS